MKNILIGILFIGAPAAWMTVSVLREIKVSCEVCMHYGGRENCGKASASDKEACVNTAKDNACALIASGMTGSIRCSQQEPLSVSVE